MMQSPYYAFTIKHGGLANQLRTNIDIVYNANSVNGVALWDTGASGSCVSEKVVNDLNLISTGRQKIFTPAGEKIVNTYLVDVVLPNKIRVNGIPVCDSDIGLQGLDMLIGMDIITMGDMSITNYNKKTFFTFRYPSQQAVDYVMQSAIKRRSKRK